MKIVFAGTPDFSIPSIEAIYNKGYELVGVITQPDRRRGRGKQIIPPAVKAWALKKGIRVYQPKKVGDREFIEEFKSLAPDILVTAAYGQILPETVLNIPTLGCINVHASLLPKYRGASPIQQAIMDGETKTGITIMYMDVSMDTGDIILQKEIEIYPKEDCGSLHDRLSILGGECLAEALELFNSGKPKGEPQDHGKASYCKKVDKSMGHIDWSMKCVDIKNLVRALTPWPGAYTYIKGERFKILRAEEYFSKMEQPSHPGTIIYADEDKGLIVKALDGLLRLSKIQAPGKRAMVDKEFLRGNIIKTGSMLD